MQWRDDSNAWREGGLIEATQGRQLEGMCIDILKELSQLLGFTFNVSLVPDKKYGSLKPPPRGWTGMVRQLKDDVSTEMAGLALGVGDRDNSRVT